MVCANLIFSLSAREKNLVLDSFAASEKRESGGSLDRSLPYGRIAKKEMVWI
jgi:hypothetical protein